MYIPSKIFAPATLVLQLELNTTMLSWEDLKETCCILLPTNQFAESMNVPNQPRFQCLRCPRPILPSLSETRPLWGLSTGTKWYEASGNEATYDEVISSTSVISVCINYS